MSESSEVVKKFMNADMHITPQALEVLKDQKDFTGAVEEVITDLEKEPKKPHIVTEKLVSQILSSKESILSENISREELENQEELKETKGQEIDNQGEVSLEERSSIRGLDTEVSHMKKSSSHRGRLGSEVKVLQDSTGQSTSEGCIEDFVQLFRDRYERLSSILKQREGFRDAIQISNLNRYEGERIKIIGMVIDKRETRKGDAKLIQLEDPTGSTTVYVKDSKRNKSIIGKIEEVVTDEVICAEVQVPDSIRGDKSNPLVWGNDITWPDIPVPISQESTPGGVPDESVCAALISDIHVGSKMFLDEVFNKFIKWLNGEVGNDEQRELASNIRYLLIAGDLVDGIGIYPRQQDELDIVDVYEQYQVVADLLSQVPDHINIIAAPGNHDAVRLAEPQPALPPEVSEPLSDIGVKLVSNPAQISIHGVKFLLYHGGGFDDLISSISVLNRKDAVAPMLRVLQKRHLAPIYGEPMGGRTPIAPEDKDYLVIEDIPDVLHCGHLHVYGSGKYRGVILINSATFQERTSYMKRLGIKPTPGIVPVINLKTKGVRSIHFD